MTVRPSDAPDTAPAATALRLLVSEAAWRRYGDRISAASPGLVVPVAVSSDGTEPDLAGVEAAFVSRDFYLGGTRDRLAPDYVRFLELLRRADKLRWVHVFATGADLWVYRELLARGVRITTSAGASAATVAQTAIAGLLALSRQIPRWIDAQRRRAWEPLYGEGEPRDLAGQTAVIVGTGAIGQEIGRLCKALGLGTVGVRNSPGATPPPGLDAAVTYPEIAAVLPRADWLVLACPLTQTTRGLVDARALALLPPGARLINVARGAVVVEADMLSALVNGSLAGAYLDVFATEPLPPDSPFWDAPGVLISPHSAAASDGTGDRVAAVFTENLRRWASGQALVNEVGKRE